MNRRVVLRELLRDKTIPRSLFAGVCADISLQGRGIDLGSKDGAGAQYRHMNYAKAEIVFSDVTPGSPGTLMIDLEGAIPIEDETFDFALMFFVLEHVFNYPNALSEAFKCLKPGGRLIGAVPQLERFHPDPDDFHRFTGSGLRRTLEQARFDGIAITPVGVGPMTAGAHFASAYLKFRILRLPLALIGLTLDWLAAKLSRKDLSSVYALSFLFEARRP